MKKYYPVPTGQTYDSRKSVREAARRLFKETGGVVLFRTGSAFKWTMDNVVPYAINDEEGIWSYYIELRAAVQDG